MVKSFNEILLAIYGDSDLDYNETESKDYLIATLSEILPILKKHTISFYLFNRLFNGVLAYLHDKTLSYCDFKTYSAGGGIAPNYTPVELAFFLEIAPILKKHLK